MFDRPIVSSCNSATENISQFIDTYVPPTSCQTTLFLHQRHQRLKSSQIPEGSILATLDVSSLYTSIPHNEGTLYAKQAYRQTFVLHTHMPHPNTIHKLMNIVLKNNIIRFADKCYLQTQGTAMGTKMTPSYANLFMGKIEQQLTHPKIH